MARSKAMKNWRQRKEREIIPPPDTLHWIGPFDEESLRTGDQRKEWRTECGRYRVVLTGSAHYGNRFLTMYRKKDEVYNRYLYEFVELKENGRQGYYPKEYSCLEQCLEAVEKYHLKRYKLGEVFWNATQAVKKARELGLGHSRGVRSATTAREGGEQVTPRQGHARVSLFGHPVTGVLRWMGKDAWTFADARKALSKLQLAVADNTIRCQLAAGRKGERGDPAALTDKEAESLYSLLD